MLSGHRTTLAQPRRAGKSTKVDFGFVRPWAARLQLANQENRSANGRALNITGRRAMKRRDFMKLGAGLGAAGLAGGLPVEANEQNKAGVNASEVQAPGH